MSSGIFLKERYCRGYPKIYIIYTHNFAMLSFYILSYKLLIYYDRKHIYFHKG